MSDIDGKIKSKIESVIIENKLGSQKKNTKKLDELTKMTENRIYKLSAIFPFDLFPNKILIEQKQVIIIYKQFFFTSQDYHILIEDILMPIVETTLFFATLKLELGQGGFHQNPPPVTNLNKKEALKAKRIIVGLTVCQKENIDLSHLSKKEISEKVEEIGRYRSD